MSKDLHNSERHLKGLSDNFNPTPPPMVWDEIEQTLDKNKGKRRLFPFFILFGTLLIGAISFLYFEQQKDKKLTTSNQESLIKENHKENDTNLKDVRSFETNTIDNLNEVQNRKDSKTVTNNYQKQSIPNFINSKTTNSEDINTSEVKQNVNNSKVIQQVSQKQNSTTVSNYKFDAISNQQVVSNNLKDATQESYKIVNSITFNNNENITTTVKDIIQPNINTLSSKSIAGDSPTTFSTLAILNWTLTPYETDLPLTALHENLFTPSDAEANERTSHNTPWFVEFGGGIGRNVSSPLLIDTTQGGLRLDTESKWYTWSTSLEFGYQFDNQFYTTVGFDLNQTKSKFDFSRSGVSSSLIEEVQNFQNVKGDYFSSGEVRYTYTDITLSIGKRFDLNKWRFSLEGGPILNVLFKANGKVQVDDLKFSRLEDQEGYFNSQIGFGARISARLDYPLSDQIWISMGPSYHQYFNPLSSKENPLEERNAILQAKASVRYHF